MSTADSVDPTPTPDQFPKDLPGDPRDSYRREQSTQARPRQPIPPVSGVPTPGIRTVMEQETVGLSFRSSRGPGVRPAPADLVPPEAGPCSTFILRQCVGMGGFGEVWEAVQVSLGRTVAVKRIQDTHYEEIHDDEEEVLLLDEQFRQEAYITAQLDHPNIVPIYDLGTDDNGHPLLAMKLVRGTPWNQLLRVDSDKLDFEEYLHRHLQILVDMAQAVAFAHSRHIVHRDLKPSQVLVGEFGEVLLMDWGLAVFVGDPEEDLKTLADLKSHIPTPVTASSPGGTPCLMAPEQTHPTAEEVTTLTDIYLLGGCLYFLLTGMYPHDDRTSFLSMTRARKGDVTDPRERANGRYIPAELADLAMKCLRKDPDDRLQSAEEFIKQIQGYLTGATSRRDSLRLTARVADRLVGLDTGVHPVDIRESRASGSRENVMLHSESIYGDFTECLNLLQQALAKWSRNPDVDTLREMVLSRYARSAIAHGDLTLAGALADQIQEREESEAIHEEVAELRRRTRRVHQQRQLAVGGALVLMGVLVAGGMIFALEQRRSAETLAVERDIARAAREAADRARLRATREQYYSSIGIADATQREGRVEKAGDILFQQVPFEFANWEWGHLLDRLQPEDMALNVANTFHAEFAPDGGSLVTGDMRGAARWDATTGAPIWHTSVASRLTWTATISRDGRWVAAASRDNTATLLDAVTGRITHRLTGHTGILRSADFSPDSRRLATASGDETVRLWDVITGTPLATFTGWSDDVYALRFSPGGEYLGAASQDDTAVLLDSTTGERLVSYEGHTENVLGIAFNPAGDRVVTAGADRRIRIFETLSGTLLRTIDNPEAYLNDAEVSPDGTLLASSDDGGRLRLWDFETGKLRAEMQADDPMWKVRFSPDGKRLVTTSRRSVRVFTVERLLAETTRETSPSPQGLASARLRLHAYGVHPSRDPVWRDRDGVWLAPSGVTLAKQAGEQWAVMGMDSDFNRDFTRRVHANRATGSAVVTEMQTGRVLATLAQQGAQLARFSPGGRLIAVAGLSETVRLFDAETLEPLGELVRPAEARRDPVRNTEIIRDMAFHPGGEVLAVSYNTAEVVLWDLANRRIVRTLEAPSAPGVCLAFSADGTMLASGGADDKIAMWDVATGKHVAEMVGHQRAVTGVSFSPDGTRLVSAAKDGSVKLWSVDSGREILTLAKIDNGDLPLAAEFEPDGHRVIMVTTDGRLQVFDSLPWRPGDYPTTNAGGMDLPHQIEWWKRMRRVSPTVTAQDVLATASGLPNSETTSTAE